jgi:MFS family permease
MALLTAHLKPWRHAGPALLWTVAGYGVATLIFGCSHWLWLSVLALFLTGVFDNVSVIIRQTTTQSVTPNELRGRVTAVSFIFISCSNELGEFESGVTAALLGPVGSVVLGALGTLAVVAGAVRLFPELMRLGRLHELAPVRLQQFTDNELIEEGR